MAERLLLKNIAEGSGLLLERVPSSVTSRVLKACKKHGINTQLMGSLDSVIHPDKYFAILFIGSSYLIARDFKVSNA